MSSRPIAIVLLMLCVLPVRAEVFPWLVQGVVEGSGHYPSEDEIRQGLSQVITRLTALREPQKHRQLAQLFESPDKIVSEYSFMSSAVDRGPRFRIGFNRSHLERQLTEASLSVWGEWRPRLLLFVVVADGASQMQVLATGGGERWRADRYRQIVERMHYRRGLLLTLPSHSYADRRIASQYVLKGDYWQAVRRLKKLYSVEGVILLHFEQVGVGKWSTGRYFFSDEIEGQLTGSDSGRVDEVMEQTLHRIGDYYWALNARHARPPRPLRLIVDGLHTYQALASTVELLKAVLPDGTALLLSRITGGRAEFDFSVQQSASELRAILGRQDSFRLRNQRSAAGFVQNLFVQFVPPSEAQAGAGAEAAP